MTQIERAIEIAFQRGYRVTDDGVIYGTRGKPLSVKKRKSVYPAFTLNSFELSPSKTYKIPIHRFAAYCFYREESLAKGIVVRHLDGDVLNFSKDNIALGTQSENHLDIPIEKRVLRAAKLSFDDVLDIRKMRADGERVLVIAEKYSVCPKTIYNVINREAFKYVS